MNYPYLQNTQNYLSDLQQMRDRIDNQMRQVERQSMTPITQNFQLVPNNNFKVVNSLEDVQREIVIADTYFLSNDSSKLWIKNTRGDIRTFELTEIKPKDEKDIMIEDLQRQINELKGGISNEYDKPNDEQPSTESSSQTAADRPAKVSTSKSSKAK